MRGDLIETYKIIKGLDTLDAGNMFPDVGESRTRGHSLRRGRPFRTERRNNFFTQRVMNSCNSLPQKAVEVIHWIAFKREFSIIIIIIIIPHVRRRCDRDRTAVAIAVAVRRLQRRGPQREERVL